MTPKQLQSHLYNKTHREQIRTRRQRHRENYRQLIDDIKESTPCADCGGSFPAICMDFDHTVGDKKFQVSKLVSEVYPWATILKEVEKCEIVCSNCHRIRTAARGSWKKLKTEGAPYDH